jgi:hypothetical protein
VENKVKAAWRDVLWTSMWLAALAAFNAMTAASTVSIIPFLVPVALVAYRAGLPYGLLVAGLATIAARAGGSIPSGDFSRTLAAAEAIFVFSKLSGIAIGMAIAHWVVRARE